MVQTTATNLVQVVDERRIVDLPLNGRNVLQLMTLNSGVADRGAQGGTIQVNTFGGGKYHVPVSINGSRGNATNFLLDNADNNDGYTNIAAAVSRIPTRCRSSASRPALSTRNTDAAWVVWSTS